MGRNAADAAASEASSVDASNDERPWMSHLQELQKMWRAFLTAGGVKDAAHRLHLICPENAARLPATMSLTAHLLASPKTMKRVQLLQHGMPGYILPESMGAAEVCIPAQS